MSEDWFRSAIEREIPAYEAALDAALDDLVDFVESVHATIDDIDAPGEDEA